MAGQVEFMRAVGRLWGMSAEVGKRAAAASHDRPAALEQVLDRIHENLGLG
jgi:hypothetical protein